MLDIEVAYGDRKQVFKALVDSGTEVTVMNAEIADFFEIDRSKCMPATLAAFDGPRAGFLATVGMRVPHFNEIITSKVIFIEDPIFDIILGQDDFFRRFKVKFEKSKNKFCLDLSD